MAGKAGRGEEEAGEAGRGRERRREVAQAGKFNSDELLNHNLEVRPNCLLSHANV